MGVSGSTVPNPFFWRRLHSVSGLLLVLFIVEHLLTNSQAALWIGQDGSGFVEMVNSIHSLPYLPAIELMLIGIPILIHGAYGVVIWRTGKSNSKASDGSTPSLRGYGRNHAYTWQRITSWVLLIGIVAHVIQMRFIEYPDSALLDNQETYIVALDFDTGLYTVADRLKVELYPQERIDQVRLDLDALRVDVESISLSTESLNDLWLTLFIGAGKGDVYNAQDDYRASAWQRLYEAQHWLDVLQKEPISNTQVIAVCNDIGTAFLLVVRDTFKSPFIAVLYTLLVLSAAFHAFNGLWTALITWGVTLTSRSQRISLVLSQGLIVLFVFFGLAAIWGTYWLNLKS